MVSRWSWAAWGKHPVAGDYINIGSKRQVFGVFSRWIEEGYDQALPRMDRHERPWSWRFWGRGPKKDSLVCGLIKGSSDRVGRHYPFLILGSGAVKMWMKHWQMLAAACETTWNRMEATAVRISRDLEQMEHQLSRIPPPSDHWEQHKRKLSKTAASEATLRPASWARRDRDFQTALYQAEKGTVVVQLPVVGGEKQSELVDGIHRRLDNLVKEIPHAVFIGGSMNQSYVVAFTRLLVTGDFRLLLNLGTGLKDCGELGTKGSLW